MEICIFIQRESVAEPNDLYASFDRVLVDHNHTIGNDLTVKEFMSNWTLQSGYPVIYVTKNKITNTFSVIQVSKINRIFHYSVISVHDPLKV